MTATAYLRRRQAFASSDCALPSGESFVMAMRSCGLNPPDAVEPGKFYRFPGVEKGKSNTAGWCKLFPDGRGGVFGDFSSNLNEIWQAARDKPMTAAERDAFRRIVEATRQQAEQELEERQAEAKKRADEIYKAASPAAVDHPYLTGKGVAPAGVKLYRGDLEIAGMECDGALLVPMRDAKGELWSLQFISPKGEKRFLPGGRVHGCYFGISKAPPRDVLTIAEGVATAATINDATGYPVVAAFDAGNLLPVARALREKYQAARMILCADDDYRTEGNPGLTKAAEAASAVGGAVAAPEFGPDRPDGATDFNDLAKALGPDAVVRSIAAAARPALDKAEAQPATTNAADIEIAAPRLQPERAPEKRPPELREPLNWRDLATKEPPARRWAIDGWLGFGHVTLLVGRGSIGKTLLSQQMASALALGQQAFIGDITGPMKALMWACEDDADELWRRQIAIARWLDAGLDAFAENLMIVPRHGLENALVGAEFGKLLFSPLLEDLRQQANDLHAEIVILDNAAQLYGGNENDRHSVTAFLNALVGALPGKAILLLAHPGRSAGSEFSGSSAWENVARARLYLGETLPDQKRDEQDPPTDDVRYLAKRKANYSARDWRRFTFRDGVLVPDAVGDASATGGMVQHIREGNAEKAVLAGLRKLAEMNVAATDGPTSPRYLPRVLVEYKLGEGFNKSELGAAMRRLMVAGTLRRGVVGKRENRSDVFGLEIA